MNEIEIRQKMLKAVIKIQDEYDAFYIENKYGNGTHNKEFNLLKELAADDNKVLQALGWIKNFYDCYYKKDYDDESSAFGYLKSLLGE